MGEYYVHQLKDSGKFQAFGPYVSMVGAKIALGKLIKGNGWRSVDSPDVHELWKNINGDEARIVGGE